MVDVEVYVKNIEGTRLSDEAKQSAEVTFNVNASITESERKQGQIALKFSIDMESQPPVVKLVIAGSALVIGEDQDIETLLAAKEADATPQIFTKIYEKVYATLYLLCGSLRIPYPSPALLKVAHVASGPESTANSSSKDGMKSG